MTTLGRIHSLKQFPAIMRGGCRIALTGTPGTGKTTISDILRMEGFEVLSLEKLAEKYSQIGVKVIGLRYFNVFGKGQSKEYAGVLKLFLERIRDQLPPKINGDGTQFRDFVYVEDVADANIMSMDSEVNHEFFNVGTNTSITILELAKTIIESAGLNMEPIWSVV